MSDLRTKLVIEAEDKASGKLAGVTDELQKVGEAADEIKTVGTEAAAAAPAVDKLAGEISDIAQSNAGKALDDAASAMGETASEAKKAAKEVAGVADAAEKVGQSSGQIAG